MCKMSRDDEGEILSDEEIWIAIFLIYGAVILGAIILPALFPF